VIKEVVSNISNIYNFVVVLTILGLVYGFGTHPAAYHTCGKKVPVIANDTYEAINGYRFYDSLFYFNPEYLARSFDFPVGIPDGENYYLASKFGNRNHLGEDWNGRGGGNTDLGDPVHAIANGVVTVAEDICCGWGNVVRVVHKLEGHPNFKYLESVYAHLDKINVVEGQLLSKGQNLGTIGTAHGTYVAHLHLELRDFIDMSMGPGYSSDWEGYLDPSAFIRNNRHF